MSAVVTIAAESPLQDEVRALIGRLNEALLALTPPEHCYHMTPEELAGPDVTVFVARAGGAAVGMGALRRHGAVGEVKRMYTAPSHQGPGVGRAILERIEALARQEGLARLVLETGVNFGTALRLYESSGFAQCGPVLHYRESRWTTFYAKPLRETAPA